MKNEITIYNLLGLIEKNKAPKKIKYDNEIWKLIEEYNDYQYNDRFLIVDNVASFLDLKSFFNIKVEIIEDDQKKIKEIDLYEELHDILNSSDNSTVLNALHKCLTLEKYKINELIREVNKLKSDNHE